MEKQRTFYERDTSRPRLETSYRVFPGGRKLRHGIERGWFENGQLRWERVYAEGEPMGHWVSYHRDGVRESETWPGNDPTPRTSTWWYPNGQRSSQGETVRGSRAGPWTTWYQSGVKESEGGYVANLKEGAWTFWHPDGRLDASGSYRAGKRVGSWVKDPDGIDAP